MAGKSDYLENALLNEVLGGINYAPAATVYIALYTANPTDAGGGTEVSAGTWTNYARVAVTNNTTNWPNASGGAKANGTAIDFGTAATTGNVTLTGFGILDAAVAGNLLYWAAFSGSPIVQNGNPVSFAIGDLDVTED